MAISFASATGNLMNRLGKIGLLPKQCRSYQNSQLTNMTDTTNGVVAQFNGESDIQGIMGTAYINQLNDPGSNIGSLAQNLAETTINRMVFRDNRRIAQNLESLNILDSIQEVIRQMKIAGATVLAMTIAATSSSFTGTGNGAINASVRRPSDGLVVENAFAETILLTCSSDSYIGGSIIGNEGFTVNGTGSQSNYFAFDWPLGSDASTGVNAIDGNTNNGSGNLLNKSGFNNWTSNVPDNWSLVTGTAGTNIIQENTIVYDGTSSVAITGDAGGTLTQIRQTLNASAGSTSTLDELSQYSFNMWVRRDGTAAAAGVITVDLYDITNSAIMQDANGTNNSFTIDLTALTTSYVAYSGVFRTPARLPASYGVRIRLSTALTNGRTIYFDKASLGEMTKIYISGPYIAVHAGSTAFIQGDYGTCAITNSRGSGGTLDTFQTLFTRLFPNEMLGSELVLPSSATPSISDGLIA